MNPQPSTVNDVIEAAYTTLYNNFKKSVREPLDIPDIVTGAQAFDVLRKVLDLVKSRSSELFTVKPQEGVNP